MSSLPADISKLVFSIIERNDRLGGQPTLELPELRPKLQFFFGDPYIFNFHRGGAGPAPLAGMWGPQTVATRSLPGRHVHVLIIDLYPQALDAFGLGPMRDFVDAVIPLDALIGSQAVAWYEEIQAALTFHARADVSVRWVRQLRGGRATMSSRAMDAMTHIVIGGTSTVERISADLDLCPRQLRRHFANEIGLSPKFTMRLQRFNRALVSLHPQPWDTSTEVHDPIASFHDQAHFIKDFQAFTGGVTPKAFVDAKRRTGDALVTTLIQQAL
ncbi:MAG: helix-turn-helix domain-containing protein [Caulobacterales bacterium]